MQHLISSRVDFEAWHQRKPGEVQLSISRRRFCAVLGASVGVLGQPALRSQGASGVHFSVAEFDRHRILSGAADALTRGLVSLGKVSTAPGRDPHTFYSEQASASYTQDTPEGEVPFLQHVDALILMNRSLSSLVAAWRLTGEVSYFNAAYDQARAWFLAEKTRMMPTLESAGVKRGVDDDRNCGVKQTVALAESARALAFLCSSPAMVEPDVVKLRLWFGDLLTWFTDSAKGSIARQAKNLDSICWAMQAAEFARFTRNDAALKLCNHLFRDGLLRQMSFDGSFPGALRDANPYATSMFTLECLASTCESLSTPFESLWNYSLPDGRGMHSAVAWAAPYLRQRGKWPYVADERHFNDEPVRQNALLFAGRAYDLPEYIDLWKTLRPDSLPLEREHPITEPALWATRPPA